MINAINNTQKSIKLPQGFREFMVETESNSAPFITMVSSSVKTNTKTATTDLMISLETVSKLKMAGGGFFPETSVESLEIAVKHLKDNGVILLASEDLSFDADMEGKVWLN
jgi:hypothetical protein